MFKLLIVFLFFLKIKSESENNFMENLLPEESTLGVGQIGKVDRSVNIKQRLFFDDLATKSHSRVFNGKIRESKQKPIEGNRNKQFRLFQESENELVNENNKNIFDQIGREKLLQENGIENLHVQGDGGKNNNLFNQFTGLKSGDQSLLINLMQPTKALKTSNYNKKLFGNAAEDQKERSELRSKYMSDITTAGNEVPFNFLKNKFEEGIEEEDSNKIYDNYDISKYKSDSRNGCLPNVNKLSNKNEGPHILFDREQDDGPDVSLMYSLINLETLRPKTKITFNNDNRIVKKCTTQEQCKRLMQASTTCLGATSKIWNTITSQAKNKNNKPKTHSNKAGHTMSLTRKTTCVSIKDIRSKKPYTPLFTIQPWPELTLTRNSCLPTHKTHLASPLTPSSPPPSILRSLGTRRRQSTHCIPITTQNTTQRDKTTTFREFSSTNSLPTSALLSTEVEGGVNTYPTEEPTVASGVTNMDQLKSSVTPTSLLTDPLNVSRGNATNPPFPTPNKYLTKDSNEVSYLTSCKQIMFSVTSSSSLPELITSNQVQPTNTETIINNSSSQSFGTTQSTPFFEMSQEGVNNTENHSSPTTAYTNRPLSSSPGQDLVNYTRPGINTPLLSSTPLNESFGTISVNVTITQPVWEQNQNNNSTTGVKSEVPQTTSSLFSQGKSSSIGVENTSAMNNTGQDERNVSNLGPLLQPTVAEDKTVPQETLSTDEFVSNLGPLLQPTVAEDKTVPQETCSDEFMSFSPPPPVVFSHEPQFIATLFNDDMGGKTECVDLSRNKGSYTIAQLEQSEPEASQLKDLFNSPVAITLAATNQPAGNIQSQIEGERVSPEAVVSEPNTSILLGHLKSVTSANRMGTYYKEPMNAYFYESNKDLKAVSNCLLDYSRIFYNIETTMCK